MSSSIMTNSTTTTTKTKTNCELCDREKNLQFHHLIPKQLHSKKKFLRAHNKQYLRTYGIYICKACHKQIHKMFTHMVLGEQLNTLLKLKENEKIQNFLKWVKKQK